MRKTYRLMRTLRYSRHLACNYATSVCNGLPMLLIGICKTSTLIRNGYA